MRRTLRNLTLATACALMLSPTDAVAGNPYRVNVDFGIASQLGNSVTELGFRAGRQLKLPLLHLRPEIGARSLLDTGEVAGFFGARFGIGAGIIPVVYGHMGASNIGGYWDAGAGLDLTFVPKYEFGASIGLVGFGDGSLLSATVHSGFKF
jgi:hypothetical protein